MDNIKEYKIADANNVDVVAKNMISLNQIPGVAKLSFAQVEGNSTIYYDFSKYVDLIRAKEFHNKKDILRIVVQICEIVLNSRRFLLNRKGFLTEIERIGYNPKSKHIMLSYVPELTNFSHESNFNALFLSLLKLGGFDSESSDKLWHYLVDSSVISLSKTRKIAAKLLKIIDPVPTNNDNRFSEYLKVDDSNKVQKTVSYEKPEPNLVNQKPETLEKENSSVKEFEIPNSTDKSKEKHMAKKHKSVKKKPLPEVPTMFWLLCHYSKENLNYYKEFQNLAKGK